MLTGLTVSGQRNMKVIFIVTNWEGSPLNTGSVHIQTDDERENKRRGLYSIDEPLTRDTKKNLTKATLTLPANRFAERSVTFTVSGSPFDYHQVYKKEGIELTDGDVFTIQLERDWEAYQNRTSPVRIGCILQDSLLAGQEYLSAAFLEVVELNIFTDDLESTEDGYIDITFGVDSGCMITNRVVVKKISGMRSDLANDFLDEVQRGLRSSNRACRALESCAIRLFWRLEK